MKRAALVITAVIAVIGISAGTMIGLAEFAPELLPKAERAPTGPPGPKGDAGDAGAQGVTGETGNAGADASATPSATDAGTEAREILKRWCSDLYNASVYHNDNSSLAADLYNDCS